ncbi:MAG TPA: porin family protein [Steroidobacteraceae bacterium]
MIHSRLVVVAALATGLMLAAQTARADDPLGFYLGGAIGQSNVRLDQSVSATATSFDEHHSGWKAIVGVRPISVVGAEMEYIDFGKPTTTSTSAGGTTQTEAQSKAAALFGMVYLPLPVPFLDIFGKAGYARLQTTADVVGVQCVAGTPGCGTLFALNRTDTRLAYGAGAQIKVATIAIRAEYERIHASTGDPDMLSLGLTWGF